MKVNFLVGDNKSIEIKRTKSINDDIKKHFNTDEVYYIKGSVLENYMQFSVNGKIVIVYDIENKG
jgi:hypothetical protein